MIFDLFSLVVLALPLTALAAPAAPVSGPEEHSSKAKTHNVTVGAYGELRYDPEYVYAKPGDLINFEFHPRNHTVTESSFYHPLRSLHGGFDTGFVPVFPRRHSSLPVREYKVTDRQPHWFYCRQRHHGPEGMVFAVNPPKKGNTFEKFQERAMGSWPY
ncbi:hypothetical protein FRC06_006911 [Ceratobasidium sp. 370]|nr:hypothetical protein FRC06_006911 [Ceratobasidium sp. 370]